MLGSFEDSRHPTFPASLTRDGQLVSVSTVTTNFGMDIWALSRDGGSWSGRPLIEALQIQYDAQVSPDGKWLAYTDSPIAKPLFRLAPTRLRAAAPVHVYDITPDGQHFLFVQEPDTPLPPSPNQIQIIENWLEELKRKVPTGK